MPIDKKIIYLLAVIIIIPSALGALNVALSDQAVNVRNSNTNELVSDGNLTVTIYDNLTNGNLIYNETFVNVIQNGSWAVMLGENISLPLEFGKIYYKDYAINNEDVNFTNSSGGIVPRQYFYSPLGDVAEEDILTTTNLTIGQRISFTFGSILDNFVSNWLRVTGNLNVTGNLTINGSSLLVGGVDVCLANGTNCQVGSSEVTFNAIVGYTTATYDGNITNGSLIGYAAANEICNIEHTGSHFCLKSEVLKTIANGNYSFNGTAWFQNGPPGFTANADDCSGWTTDSSSYLGPFWNWEANAQAGKAALTNCAQEKVLMCCGGGS